MDTDMAAYHRKTLCDPCKQKEQQELKIVSEEGLSSSYFEQGKFSPGCMSGRAFPWKADEGTFILGEVSSPLETLPWLTHVSSLVECKIQSRDPVVLCPDDYLFSPALRVGQSIIFPRGSDKPLQMANPTGMGHCSWIFLLLCQLSQTRC